MMWITLYETMNRLKTDVVLKGHKDTWKSQKWNPETPNVRDNIYAGIYLKIY